jgi:hypothetical protein
MNVWFQVRTRVAALLAIAVALAGAALVLQLAVLLIWQYGIALQTRSWPRLPVALLFADHAQLAASSAAPLLQFIPQLEWTWIHSPAGTSPTHTIATWIVDKVHIGVAPALLGVLVVLGGIAVFLGQRSALAAARRRKADRLRRVGAYRNHPYDERQEPLEHRGERSEHRDERFEYRKEPFIGADV